MLMENTCMLAQRQTKVWYKNKYETGESVFIPEQTDVIGIADLR